MSASRDAGKIHQDTCNGPKSTYSKGLLHSTFFFRLNTGGMNMQGFPRLKQEDCGTVRRADGVCECQVGPESQKLPRLLASV